jgi:hypothetical protein
MKLTRNKLKNIIIKEIQKAAPFGSGMEQAKIDKAQKEVIGHT